MRIMNKMKMKSMMIDRLKIRWKVKMILNKSFGENYQSRIFKYLHHHAVCAESESSDVILSGALFGTLK